nr:hypothetical protein [uncultured Anaerosporobacter sp.]
MSLKKIVNDVVVAGVTGVVFAGIAYGLSKAFKALKLKMTNKGGSNATKGSGKSLYDSNGNYTGGRNQAELDTLARDPAHAGSTRQYDIDQGILEQKIGLSLEESGKVPGPLTRDPSGAAEFFDSTGQAWDVKSFNSNYKPSKGGYTLQKSMDSILDSLGKNENVMLDTSNLSLAHKTELLNELSKQGLMDKVILWP